MQFVQRCQDGAEFAVKFFLAPGAYESELAYYQNPALREILVPVAHSEGNGGGVVRSKGGYVFPPFIIVERGEVWPRTAVHLLALACHARGLPARCGRALIEAQPSLWHA